MLRTSLMAATAAAVVSLPAQAQDIPIGHLADLTGATASIGVAYAAGAVLEAAWRILRLRGEPPMTRFLAEQLSTPHWYDISAARRDFGYVPRVSTAEGLQRLASWWRSRT